MAFAQGAGGTREFLGTAAALAGGWRRVAIAFGWTAAINCLALTGPLYMLLLFDRILPSAEVVPLVAASAAMLALYALSGILDIARQSLLMSCANRAERSLAVLAARNIAPVPINELAAVGSILRGQIPAALCDAPWVPLYFAALVWLHPLFGAVAVLGAIAIAGCMLAAPRRFTIARAARGRTARRSPAAAASQRSMRRAWLAADAQRRDRLAAAAYDSAVTAATMRALRPALQSTTLGLGGYLVMTGACHAGNLLAASIILARLLNPIEIVIAQWRSLAAAHRAARRLATLLGQSTARDRIAAAAARGTAELAGVRIVLRQSRSYARKASRGETRSLSSDLRPTAQ